MSKFCHVTNANKNSHDFQTTQFVQIANMKFLSSTKYIKGVGALGHEYDQKISVVNVITQELIKT